MISFIAALFGVSATVVVFYLARRIKRTVPRVVVQLLSLPAGTTSMGVFLMVASASREVGVAGQLYVYLLIAAAVVDLLIRKTHRNA